MKQLNLDLGYTDAEKYGSLPDAVSDSQNRTRYPEFTYADDGEPLDIPPKGKMVIEYEEVAREDSKRNGKTRYVCTVSVKKIVGVEGSKPDKKSKDERADDALDRIARESGYGKDDDDDDDDEA